MKHRLQCIGLAVVALLLALCVVELGLRLAAPCEFIQSVERDPVLGWRGRPNVACTYRHPLSGVAFPIEQNERGFRDRAHELTKPEGFVRALFVGDSFTWGWGVSEESIYTRVLERALAGRAPPVEVMNAGVPGYNTVQSLLYLRTEGFRYSPDVVVYQASDNDITGNRPPVPGGVWLYPYARAAGDGASTVEGTPLPDLGCVGWLKYHAARHSRLGYLLRSRVDCWRQLRARAAAGRVACETRPASRPFGMFAGLIRAMGDDCAEHGASFVALLDFPISESERELLRSVCGGIEVLTIESYLRSREEMSGEDAFIPGDGHWTERGHAWVAECLVDSVFSASARARLGPGTRSGPFESGDTS